jgi:methyl-accepting chemotaxis protein
MSKTSNEFLMHMADVAERAATGDLEARVLHIPHDGPEARIGHAMNHLLDIADAYVRESAAAMDHCSHNLFHRPILERGLLGSYRDSAAIINNAASKMKDDAENLQRFEAERAAVAHEVSEGTTAVAAACEELNATTSEISDRVGEAANMTHGALRESQQSLEAMQQLEEAAKRIEEVVALIAKVARHTNLLALNATIEAARAGVHGRGFAVVANEVKALSSDTAQATQEIGQTVESMLDATKRAANGMRRIGVSVKDIDTNQTAIRVSLSEQLKATGEIAHRITEISNRTRDMDSGPVSRAA